MCLFAVAVMCVILSGVIAGVCVCNEKVVNYV